MKRIPVFFILLSIFLMILSCQNQSISSIQKQDNMVLIPGGVLSMGGDNDQASRNEFPKHKVQIDAYWMDQTEVTNTQFAKFVEATSYLTVAERPIDWEVLKTSLPPNTPKLPDSLLQPGALVFTATERAVSLANPAQWWHWVIGANWQHPGGPESSIRNKMDHPVVQIAWEDANAYAKWAKKRLPTEAEWEWAARGGKKDQIYPWGNESVNAGAPRANFWQGLFPYQNDQKDGYLTTAPVKSYEANGYGLYDMSGNVWEWCSDWLDVAYYQKAGAKKANSQGPAVSYNPASPLEPERVIRGGSFLCNDSYCSGYRNARRMGSSTDTGLNHTGFRCVRNVNQEK